MSKLMITTSLFLFWAFYEMSGGADFKPPERPTVVQDTVAATVEPEESTIQVVLASADVTTAPVADIVTVAFDAPPQDVIPAVTEVAATQEPVPEPAEELVAEPIVETSQLDIRFVAGSRVNMRDGPSTDYAVLDTLSRGTQAEVLEVTPDGWAQIRLLDSDATGWMAERLLDAG